MFMRKQGAHMQSFVNEAAISGLGMPSPSQFRAARAVLRLSMREMARELRVGNSTIVRLETEEGYERANETTIRAIARFYEEHGVQFIERDDGRIGAVWFRPQR
jgi:hypothetical protein